MTVAPKIHLVAEVVTVQIVEVAHQAVEVVAVGHNPHQVVVVVEVVPQVVQTNEIN